MALCPQVCCQEQSTVPVEQSTVLWQQSAVLGEQSTVLGDSSGNSGPGWDSRLSQARQSTVLLGQSTVHVEQSTVFGVGLPFRVRAARVGGLLDS